MRHPRASFAALFVGLVFLAGCGSDNPAGVTTFDEAAPAAPSNVRSELRGAQAALVWDANSEASVIGYDVFVYSPDPSRESAYVQLNSAPVSDTEYVLGLGAPASWYRVKAVTSTAKRSAGSTPEMVETPDVASGNQSGSDPIEPGVTRP